MIGLLLFFVFLLILGVIVKMLCEMFFPGNAKALQIAMLVLLLFALLWLFGGGGWGYTYNYHPWAHP
jgi:hypothetical protein